MKRDFYPRLAWDGIRKNRRLYTPYLLTCIGMVVMYYIILFLGSSPAIQELPGSTTLSTILELGSWTISLFSLLFLFYSNSFLIRRREKEFGLYNILGMGKWNVSKILFWESLMIAGISLTIGLSVGIGVSKLFELFMLNMISGQTSYAFTVSASSIGKTVLVFGGIFALIFLNALRQISFSNAVTLLRGENVGDKPPKARWLVALAGVVMLATAYYMAATVHNPVQALSLFFAAVLLVIAATYLLFVSGSVALCRLLQNNKRYYYRSNHFVSVSSMTYRMKRNGTGLASICILLTMVLVMLSSTATLFVGTEDSLRSRYPKDINVFVQRESYQQIQQEQMEPYRSQLQTVLDRHHASIQSAYDYRAISTSGMMDQGALKRAELDFALYNTEGMEEPVLALFVPVSDYNLLMGQNETLEDDEVLIYPFRTEYHESTFRVDDGEAYRVKTVVDSFVTNGDSAMTIFPTIIVFANDPNVFFSSGDKAENKTMVQYGWFYAVDVDVSAEEQIQIAHELRELEQFDDADIELLEANRMDFYSIDGGLFFLGIMLSLVFLAAAVLIIYYKQISEGYEDQARFEIMQKVGMTKREIRRSINSQMLTVFFLPLVTAGLHLMFAFPMIHKMLQMFNIQNTPLLVSATVGCFLVFGVFYILVYRITSNAYFSIVSGAKGERN